MITETIADVKKRLDKIKSGPSGEPKLGSETPLPPKESNGPDELTKESKG
jgi:hypothetical protein